MSETASNINVPFLESCVEDVNDLKTYVNDFVNQSELSTLQIGYRLGIIVSYLADLEDKLIKATLATAPNE